MELEKVTEELIALIDSLNGHVAPTGEFIPGIINWIEEHPNTDPNAYEIMDCNVRFAQIIAKYKACYIALGELTPVELGGASNSLAFIMHKQPKIAECFASLEKMDRLRDTANHPFFTTDEAKTMYTMVKICQEFATYEVPEDEQMQEIKRETLCKSMSVPFYIWQEQRRKPNYQYDNEVEFEGMKTAFALYEATESPCQFAPMVAALHNKIEQNYKYATPQETPKIAIK